MKKLNIIVLISSILAFSLAYAAEPEHKDFQFEKKPELRHIHPGKPVKIKLKRSTTGKYSWDLTGDNLSEIIDIDSKLRKLLDVQ